LAEQSIEPGSPRTAALMELSVSAAVAAEAERALRNSVRSAREAGATWEQVGTVLGVKKQTAWEKYSGDCQ